MEETRQQQSSGPPDQTIDGAELIHLSQLARPLRPQCRACMRVQMADVLAPNLDDGSGAFQKGMRDVAHILEAII